MDSEFIAYLGDWKKKKRKEKKLSSISNWVQARLEGNSQKWNLHPFVIDQLWGKLERRSIDLLYNTSKIITYSN